MSARDDIFGQDDAPSEFRFDETVARVFPDMLRRSIPGYSTLLHLIGVLASDVVQAGTCSYDLGCSLGAVSLSIRHALGARDARIVGIDNSEAMVARCREIMSADSGLCPVDIQQGDITALSLKPSSLVVLNFTLQFAPIEERAAVIQTIADSLVPGGVLVLSEKTAGNSEASKSLYTEIHDAFRRSNGYSQLELSRKRESLERVLVPETDQAHLGRLTGAGLEPVEWFRCLHFVSWVAKKPG